MTGAFFFNIPLTWHDITLEKEESNLLNQLNKVLRSQNVDRDLGIKYVIPEDDGKMQPETH